MIVIVIVIIVVVMMRFTAVVVVVVPMTVMIMVMVVTTPEFSGLDFALMRATVNLSPDPSIPRLEHHFPRALRPLAAFLPLLLRLPLRLLAVLLALRVRLALSLGLGFRLPARAFGFAAAQRRSRQHRHRRRYDHAAVLSTPDGEHGGGRRRLVLFGRQHTVTRARRKDVCVCLGDERRAGRQGAERREDEEAGAERRHS